MQQFNGSPIELIRSFCLEPRISALPASRPVLCSYEIIFDWHSRNYGSQKWQNKCVACQQAGRNAIFAGKRKTSNKFIESIASLFYLWRFKTNR